MRSKHLHFLFVTSPPLNPLSCGYFFACEADMTARELLQSQLDALNADIAANPIVVDPRLEKKAQLEADIAGSQPWYDYDLDVIKAFIGKYL